MAKITSVVMRLAPRIAAKVEGIVSRTGSARVAGNMPQLPFPPTVVGIAGCSGSGKTTLANELARLMRGLRFHLDDYYLDLSDIPLAERVEKNFDDPALIEIPLLAEHVAALARGESIERPVYDFGTYTRVRGRTQHVNAGPFLIVEGNLRALLPGAVPVLSPAHLHRYAGGAVFRAAAEARHGRARTHARVGALSV